MTTARALPSRERAPAGPQDRGIRAVVAVLPDGTPYYAPHGTVVCEGAHVQCHLCGGWFRSVLAHLRAHGWGQVAYRAAFGLELGQSLEGEDTRKRRADALRVRRRVDPSVRNGCRIGQQLAHSGELTRAAAAAARGRRQPEQRRRKTLQTLAAISPAARAEGSRRHADARLHRTAADAAARFGYPDIGSLVRDQVAAGRSLAQISRAAGWHKDWLCRHLRTVDPAAARDVLELVTGPRPPRHDARWMPAVHALGFADVAGYLRTRHVTQRRTVASIAAEVGMTYSAVEGALARHGIERTPFAASRARYVERAAAVAERFGHPDLASYLRSRRAAGLSWRSIADECGEPATWLRRRAGLA